MFKYLINVLFFSMCVLQEMLGLTKPLAPGQQGRPMAPQDAGASCRCDMEGAIASSLMCKHVLLSN